MNANSNDNINVNVNFNDISTQTDPPTVNGNDSDTTAPVNITTSELNTSTSTAPASNGNIVTSTSTTTTTTTTTQNIFGFVQSLFTNVVQSWAGFDWFNRRTFMPTFGWGAQTQRQSGFMGLVNNVFNYGASLFGFNQTTTTTSSEVKTVTLNDSGNKEVWLSNDSDDVAINATNTTGNNILAGNNKDNQIFGGNGNNDMWGGNYKTNDYLFGGAGQNTFWYGKGEGIDLVENTKRGDTINLYNITLGDISNVEITDSSITLVIGDSEGIGVSSSDEVSPTFKLSNGESYSYNRSSAEWQQA